MAFLRLGRVGFISASFVALSLLAGCSEEIKVVQGKGAGPEGEAPGDPLDTAPEGEPVCTKEGYCWDFPYTPSSITSLHSSAANALWAVGTNGTILRSHSRGDAWRVMPTGVVADLNGVFSIDRNHAWAVGAEGMVLAFDGTTWTRIPVPVENKAILRGVWASSASDVWIVGAEQRIETEPESGVAIHWDGAAWTRVTHALPTLYAVHGKDKEVWIAGGTFETPMAMRYDGARFNAVDTMSLASSRSVYGPALGIWVNDASDVLVTAGQMNTSTIARYTGSEWKIEGNQLYSRSPLGGFGRALDGSPIVVGNPPLKADAEGKWVPLSEDTSYGALSAIWSVDEEVTVYGGKDGLLGTSPTVSVRPAASKPTNLDGWVLAEDGVYRFDDAAKRWSRSVAPSIQSDWDEYFIDAVQTSDNDIFVTSALYSTYSDEGVPPKYRSRQWDGKSWTIGALPEKGNYARHTVAKTKSGDLWFAQPGSGAPLVRKKAGGEAPLGACTGDSSSYASTSFVWTAGDDVFFWGYRGIYHVSPNGSCTFTPLATAVGDKREFVTAAGGAPNDVWLVTKSTDYSSDESSTTYDVFRFEGSSWKKVATKSQEIVSVRVLESGGTFVFGQQRVMTWNGNALVDVAMGLTDKEGQLSGLWGKTASTARFVGAGGRILSRKN